METMKYPNISGGSNMPVNGNGPHEDDVDSLFTSPCWQNSSANVQTDFMDTNKLILDGSLSNLSSDKLLLESSMQDNEIATKATMDAIDNLLLNSQAINANSLAELKPLPPFTGYTGHLSINGIPGHHYHTISQRIPEENNNTYNSYHEQNSLVSSSTCNVSADSAGDSDAKSMYGVEDVKLSYTDCVNPDSVSSAKMYDECGPNAVQVKPEIPEYDLEIDDIAAIIGSAIADTTVPNTNPETDDATASRDSWMDLETWMDTVGGDQQKIIITHTQDGMEFGMQQSPHNPDYKLEYSPKMQSQQTPTLQNILTHGYMPLLQSRLQNGPPVKQEASSTNYGVELTSSPPANVVSTTDNLMMTINGRYMSQYVLNQDDRIRSPDVLGQNYPHTTTTTPSPKKSRRAQKKQQQASSSTVFQTDQNIGLMNKEKPVHRCTICNRGFLNKSNIKVHLRTHTGEKPFRCETCAKAFRQKAHLIKHQQIHKRIGRD